MGDIKKVGVIGAGVMGSGIAAHVANAGVPVVLLDIVPKGANDRNALAAGALAKMAKQSPAPFMSSRAQKLVTAGNLEDDLDKLKDCDWICEAIIEKVEIKRDLYKKLSGIKKPDAIVTSNTSTIPLKDLLDGQTADFAKRFAITHFFNPPRYMRLLELVKGPKTDADVIPTLRAFGDARLGKVVVDCKDTPGFIGNRIGIFWSTVALSSAMRLGLTIEEADSIVGKPMGVPKTGIFGLIDLTGVDLAPHVNESMRKLLPPSDDFHRVNEPDGMLAKTLAWMIPQGLTGRKGKGGFYKVEKGADGKRSQLSLDYATKTYRKKKKSELASAKAGAKNLRKLVEHPDKGGQYAWIVLAETLSYAASLVDEISGSVADVDAAMRTGYAWKWGPFELIDKLGAKWFAERLRKDGRKVPPIIDAVGDGAFYRESGEKAEVFSTSKAYRDLVPGEGAWRLADKKRGKQPVASNKGASIWDVGDGVACLEFHTKMNAIDADIIAMVKEAAKIDKKGFKALMVGSDSDNFSVGANVGIVLFAANTAMWPLIEQSIGEGQQALMGLKYAPFPVVGAAAGMALGGGCEVLLHCAAVQAHAESYMGLVEVGVGVIPGFGGCKELLTRWSTNKKRPGGPMPPVVQAFETISVAKVSRSAAEAQELLFLRPTDGISMNRDRVLADAKARALSMVPNYKAPEPVELFLPGATARAALAMAVEGFAAVGKATPHDIVVSAALGRVLTGGDVDHTMPVKEQDILRLEREAFMSLIKTNATLDRIEHMLTTGKPLRN